MWHRRVHPVPGQILGLSPIAVHAMTIGTGISAMRFGAQWFEEGAHPTGMLTTSKNLNQTQAATAKSRFMTALAGKREPVVLGGDWKYQTVQVKANESQFLETHGYTAAECCRIFGPGYAEIFGYETGGSLTYSNIEQRSLDFLTYAADPWLVRTERVLTGLLPPGWRMKFNRRALVRTDLLTRYRAHAIALRNQFRVINEVRSEEDWQPVEWGDEPVLVGAPGPEEKVD
jgi:HK97 family phage portal protein